MEAENGLELSVAIVVVAYALVTLLDKWRRRDSNQPRKAGSALVGFGITLGYVTTLLILGRAAQPIQRPAWLWVLLSILPLLAVFGSTKLATRTSTSTKETKSETGAHATRSPYAPLIRAMGLALGIALYLLLVVMAT